MLSRSKNTPLLLMVSNGQTRNYLLNLLQENDFIPITIADPSELLQALKKQDLVVVHVEAPDECGHMGDIKKKILHFAGAVGLPGRGEAGLPDRRGCGASPSLSRG